MKIAIIGGGIAGLSTAYYLQKHLDAEIDLHEKSSDIGGLAGTLPIGDTHIEKYYHHIFTHDNYYLDLAEELGLADQIVWYDSRVGYYHQGISYPFTTPFDLLRFTALSPMNRLRFGLSAIRIANYRDLDQLESLTTEQFMIKFVGQQGWDVIWKPMLKIKFGDNYNKIPAVWIWERIVQRIRSRSNGGNKELLGYMNGSFHILNEKLLQHTSANGLQVKLNSPVEEIVIRDNKAVGLKVNGQFLAYDSIICTAALPVFVNLCKNADESYLNPLRQIEYDCALVGLMVLDRRLSDYYWLNISDNDMPFGGLIEHTNLISEEIYGGKHLLYFSRYLSVNDPLYRKSDKEVQDVYVAALKKIYNDFSEDAIVDFIVSRDRYAQPIWPMHYSKIKPDYKTPVDNLYLSNTSQIYPNDRGMNFSVKLGKEVAEELVRNMK